MSKAVHVRFLDIAADLGPTLAEAIAARGPQRLKRRDDGPLADYLCRAVAGQQLSVVAARTIWGRVEALCAKRPLGAVLAEVEEADLRGCGLSAAKCRAVRTIAEAGRAGALEARALAPLTSEERKARLTALKGVGPWTADMINMFYFADPDIWPDGDVAARKTLERLTSRRRKTVRTAELFAPHRSYLALYMWSVADAPPV
ncbi:MAG: DNA-3-methyladenine glycosylase 2 family protein [Pseudomonadota bacterium]